MEPDINKIANIIADIQQSIKDQTESEERIRDLEEKLDLERDVIDDELCNQQNLRTELNSYIEEIAPISSNKPSYEF